MRYRDLNETERKIVDGWIAGGMEREDALTRLNHDLDDAAEEDGYDGP